MKKSAKRLLAILISAALILCTLPITVFAASDYSFTYEIIEGYEDEFGSVPSTVWITGYKGTLPSKLKIPAKINGYAVECIEPLAFESTGIKEVVIPEGVYWIDDYAFAKCKSLTKITLPASLGYIGNGAFFKCSKIKTIVYNGYNYSYNYLYIGDYNDNINGLEWTWTHYKDDYDYEQREYTMKYLEERYLEPACELHEGDTVFWDFYGDSLWVDENGYAYANSKGETYVDYEVVNADGDVIFAGEDIITVKYSVFQWIIEYILFGWVWGY